MAHFDSALFKLDELITFRATYFAHGFIKIQIISAKVGKKREMENEKE